MRINATREFNITYTPRDTANYTLRNLFFYNHYSPDLNRILSGIALDNRNHQTELGVHAGGTSIANGGTVDFGSKPTIGGIENIIFYSY